MFHKDHFILRIVGALVLIGALIVGGAALFRVGQASGYALGAASAGTNLTAPAPAPFAGPGGMRPYPFFGRGMHFAPFGLLGLGMFVVFFAVGGMFRMFIFRRHMMHHMIGHEGMGHFGQRPCTGPTAAPKDPPPSEPTPPAQ